MLVFIYYYCLNVLFPQLRAIVPAISEGIGTIIVICIGISLIGGFSIFRNVAGAVATGTADVAIVLIRAFFSGIAAFLGWFFGIIPRVHNSVRESLIDGGCSETFASFMGVITSIIVIAIII